MSRKIKIRLNAASIDAAIQELNAYQNSMKEKAKLMCKRLADIGLINASANFVSEFYVGTPGVHVSVEERENGYAVVADGETVLILEFGAGVTYGDGHPMANTVDPKMGPGTHPDKHYRMYNGKLYANWENPSGWYLPKEKGGGHTYGNPPTMAMYNAAQDIRSQVERIAQEVFAT